MPAGDIIFQRLEKATEAELHAMAIALREEEDFLEQTTRPEKIDFLSRWLRKDAGSAFKTPFRTDHELPYFKVLEDVLERAASEASWKTPKLDDTIPVERLEDYVLEAFAYAASPKAGEDGERARKAAEHRLLTGEVQAPASFGAGKALLVFGAGAMVGVVGVGIGFGAAWIAGPAVRRTTPAVLVLIHVRERMRLESDLGRAA